VKRWTDEIIWPIVLVFVLQAALTMVCIGISCKTHNTMRQFVSDIQLMDIEPDEVGK